MGNLSAFIVNSILLGIGLAMDAFSVSMANGLNYPKMTRSRIILVAGTFGFFQFIMPVIGWFFVKTAVSFFEAFKVVIPWIALILLSFIGGKMFIEGVKNSLNSEYTNTDTGLINLLIQGIATSIDALSVGFTISNYNLLMVLCAALLIAAVTFGLCVIGVCFGKKFGMKLARKASILGGVILIGIGIEIFVRNLV